jgi:hypothetical protein
MGRFTPEAGGEKPQSHGLSDFKILREQRSISPRIQKPEELQQQRPLPKNTGELRGQVEPFQPNPAVQQAAERLGKPLPEGEAVVFRRGSPQPEQQSRRSNTAELMPRSKKGRIARLIELYEIEIHLPDVTADLTPDEEAQLHEWANSLSYKELGQEIRKRREKLNQDLDDQWPRGLVRV